MPGCCVHGRLLQPCPRRLSPTAARQVRLLLLLSASLLYYTKLYGVGFDQPVVHHSKSTQIRPHYPTEAEYATWSAWFEPCRSVCGKERIWHRSGALWEENRHGPNGLQGFRQSSRQQLSPQAGRAGAFDQAASRMATSVAVRRRKCSLRRLVEAG